VENLVRFEICKIELSRYPENGKVADLKIVSWQERGLGQHYEEENQQNEVTHAHHPSFLSLRVNYRQRVDVVAVGLAEL